jgi:hypothetical protein
LEATDKFFSKGTAVAENYILNYDVLSAAENFDIRLPCIATIKQQIILPGQIILRKAVFTTLFHYFLLPSTRNYIKNYP